MKNIKDYYDILDYMENIGTEFNELSINLKGFITIKYVFMENNFSACYFQNDKLLNLVTYF